MNTSRFFRTTDYKVDKVGDFVIPPTWWSRFYEYPWASWFIEKGETVLDAGCGIEHPFKFLLGYWCDAYACDLDPAINKVEIPLDRDLHLCEADMTNLPYPGNTFDKVFCISVIEHLDPASRRDALIEFYRVLKPSGKLIMTLDYPTSDPQELAEMLKACGFSFAGDVDFSIPDDAISAGDLKCYRVALTKGSDL